MSSLILRPTGKQIKKALIDLDLTPLELSQAMGVSVIYIRYIMAERRTAETMRGRIAKYLRAQYRRNGYRVPRFVQQKEKAA